MEQEEKEKADKELADREEEEFKKLDKPPDSNDKVKV